MHPFMLTGKPHLAIRQTNEQVKKKNDCTHVPFRQSVYLTGKPRPAKANGCCSVPKQKRIAGPGDACTKKWKIWREIGLHLPIYGGINGEHGNRQPVIRQSVFPAIDGLTD